LNRLDVSNFSSQFSMMIKVKKKVTKHSVLCRNKCRKYEKTFPLSHEKQKARKLFNTNNNLNKIIRGIKERKNQQNQKYVSRTRLG
jgi:aromatic ring hydroxylase